MKVTLLDHTADPVNKIGEMASICYDSRTDRASNIKRAAQWEVRNVALEIQRKLREIAPEVFA